MPIFRECQRCAACCRWPGQVRLTGEEITRIAAFLKLAPDEFIQRHTRLRSDRRGLVLEEKPDGACIFLEDGACAIQPVKPQQCRDFPNLWQYPGADQFCHAIPREVEEAEYVRLVAAATRRPPAEVRAWLQRQARAAAG
ncbi:MAG TPA: YkgJ family cysteine cluster protein [Verrucomicrobiota bacterium]|nr:YkgJ family cysteine cluster protein [Verrucomicrobiota bacterium]HNT13233.1 YkgJ family cysteine cluster protein [Verrucomicrobiota bacterium]